MLNIKDVVIDANRTLGNTMLLTEVRPYYEYKDGVKSDTVAGYKYSVCRKKDLEKIAVKVPGKQQIEAPKEGYIEVKFNDLAMTLYMMDGKPQVTASASAISLAGK